MKRTIYICLSALAGILMSSCLHDDPGTGGEDGMQEMTFTVNIPDARAIVSRAAWEAGDLPMNQIIDNMYVLVFDSNGFISRHRASQGSGPSQFKVTLPTSAEARVLHFVCNYHWNGFIEEDARHQSEAMILADMTVPYPTVTYWAREEMPTGISGTTLNPVTLHRNVAKISVVNNSKAAADSDPLDDVTSYLTDVTYAIGNYYDKGTLAPFNTVTGLFDTNALTEAPGAALMSVETGDFMPAYEVNLSDTNGRSAFTYERKKSESGSADRIYIILKANYHANDTDVAGTDRYYKIDIALPQGVEELYDIWRNRHYVVTIGQAVHRGYATFPEAVAGYSLNNFATSIEQTYNSVSDGAAILNLEYVNRTFVTGGAHFEVRYSYIDGTTRQTDNTDVAGYVSHTSVPSIDLPEGPLTPGGPNLPNRKANGLPSGEYLDYVNGYMVGATPASGTTAESSIRISKLGLSRTIVLKLREPYSFAPYSINPATVGSHANETVDITVTIPAELQDFMPFYIYVENATMLMPVQGSGIYFDDQGSSFRYRYQIDTPGAHILHFKTGSTTGSATALNPIKIRGDLFDENANLTLARN